MPAGFLRCQGYLLERGTKLSVASDDFAIGQEGDRPEVLDDDGALAIATVVERKRAKLAVMPVRTLEHETYRGQSLVEYLNQLPNLLRHDGHSADSPGECGSAEENFILGSPALDHCSLAFGFGGQVAHIRWNLAGVILTLQEIGDAQR